MTESEAIKKHIDECNNRIENISFFMYSNSDANKEECCNNIEILQMAINALEKIDNIKKIIDCTIICNDANKAKYDAIRKIVNE